MSLCKLAQSKLKKCVLIDSDRKDFGTWSPVFGKFGSEAYSDKVNYILQGSKKPMGPDGLGFDETVSVSDIIIFVGSETVATALSGALYYLL